MLRWGLLAEPEMSLTPSVCPACGAPAPATGGACAWCGATLIAPAAASPAGRGPAPGPSPRPGEVGAPLTVVMHGLGPAQVPLLVQILGRPAALMAQVPSREPPAVFGVAPALAEQLRGALAPLGISLHVGQPFPFRRKSGHLGLG